MYDRDAIIAAVDLPLLADELLGPRRGRGNSATWRCPDPHHAQTGKTPPMSIFTSHRGEQRWRCHGCGAGGTAIDLVMACYGTGPRGALDELARRTGHTSRATAPLTRRRRTPGPTARPLPSCHDQEGMDRYVAECATALFTPQGAWVRNWLVQERGLTEEVLRANRLGADLGPRRQWRPHGMPNAAGAVLPVLHGKHAVYTQVRIPQPGPDRPRYLNPAGDLAVNPRLAFFRPPVPASDELIVTEGAMDALSANVAGYRSAALLSAAYGDRVVARRLAREPRPLVIAFDNDAAGQAATQQLTALLAAEQRPPCVLSIPANDLNEALLQSADWPAEFPSWVGASRATGRSGPARSFI